MRNSRLLSKKGGDSQHILIIGLLIIYELVLPFIFNVWYQHTLGHRIIYLVSSLVMTLFLGLSICLTWSSLEQYFKGRFRIKQTLYWILLIFLVNLLWDYLTSQILNFPVPQNQLAVQSDRYLSGVTAVFAYFQKVFLGPLSEEVFYRLFPFVLFAKFKSVYLDVLISSLFFGFAHVMGHSFVISDFVYYSVAGFFLAILLRKTQSVYPNLILHIIWNSGLLFFMLSWLFRC